jgi:hypothetical protein
MKIMNNVKPDDEIQHYYETCMIMKINIMKHNFQTDHVQAQYWNRPNNVDSNNANFSKTKRDVLK